MKHDPEIQISHSWTIGKIKKLLQKSFDEKTTTLIIESQTRQTLIPYTVCRLMGGIFLVDRHITIEFLEEFIENIQPRKVNMTPPSGPLILSYEKGVKLDVNNIYINPTDRHYVRCTYKPLSPGWSVKKISIVSLMKNAELYLPFFTWVFSKILETTKYSFEFYILENDSTDNSEKILKKFLEDKNGDVYSGHINWNKNIRAGMNMERGKYMCNLRNELKRRHGVLDSDYTIILDTDVYFKPNCIFKLIRRLTKGVVMSTCFGNDWNVIQNYGSSHYYDTFAYITNDGISHKETGNKCLFKGCKLCEPYLKKVGLLDKRYSDDEDIIPVNSAFGGIVALRTEHYNTTDWEPTICEHHGFCGKLRSFGNIIVSRDIETMIAKEYHDFLERSKLVVKVLEQ